MARSRKAGQAPWWKCWTRGGVRQKKVSLSWTLTSIVAGGCHAVVFSTGKGNCSGHPIAPVIKISGNPATAATLRDNIDVDVSGVIQHGMSLDEAADLVENKLADVCWGAMTSADMLSEIETAASRILRTL